jgi:hypothetical protein
VPNQLLTGGGVSLVSSNGGSLVAGLGASLVGYPYFPLPPAYGSDLERADRAIRQADAEAMSRAASLVGVYSPMYRLRAASTFVPGSFLAIEPETPPLPEVDQSYLDPDQGGAEQAPPP